MAFKYGFYNSLNGDRKYDAMDMNSIFDGVISDGIIKNFGGAFKVIANGDNSVKVAQGRAWLNHTWNYNESDMVLDLPAPHLSLPRIDAVIIRVSHGDRENKLMVLEGTASSTPENPKLTEGVDFPLAFVNRKSNVATVSNNDITDCRGGSKTPWSYGILNDSYSGTPEMHRSIYRGRFLGNSIEESQIEKVRDGSFHDIFIGDYWVMQDTKWRVADILVKYGNDSYNNNNNNNYVLLVPDFVDRMVNGSANNRAGVSYSKPIENYYLQNNFVPSDIQKYGKSIKYRLPEFVKPSNGIPGAVNYEGYVITPFAAQILGATQEHVNHTVYQLVSWQYRKLPLFDFCPDLAGTFNKEGSAVECGVADQYYMSSLMVGFMYAPQAYLKYILPGKSMYWRFIHTIG